MSDTSTQTVKAPKARKKATPATNGKAKPRDRKPEGFEGIGAAKGGKGKIVDDSSRKLPHTRMSIRCEGLTVDVIATLGDGIRPPDDVTMAAREKDLPELKEGQWLSSEYDDFVLFTRSQYDGRPVPVPLYVPMTVAHPCIGAFSATVEVLVLPDRVPRSKAPADLTQCGWAEVRHPKLSVFLRTATDFHSEH